MGKQERYDKQGVTPAQIKRIRRRYEARLKENETQKQELIAFIKGWCEAKHGNLKRLAGAAGISSQALHSYLSGTGRAGIERFIALAELINSMD